MTRRSPAHLAQAMDFKAPSRAAAPISTDLPVVLERLDINRGNAASGDDVVELVQTDQLPSFAASSAAGYS